MGRRNRSARRTSNQAQADRRADDLARDLGRALRAVRLERGLTQSRAAAAAGLSASAWSYLELAHDGRVTLATWNRAATALGSSLKAYLQAASGADLPRDHVHLRHQELVIQTATPGGWQSLPELRIEGAARDSRHVDLLLHRRRLEYALNEIWDWFDDVGRAGREWQGRLEAVERHALARMAADDPSPRVGGFWVVRATPKSPARPRPPALLPVATARIGCGLACRAQVANRAHAISTGADLGDGQGRPAVPGSTRLKIPTRRHPGTRPPGRGRRAAALGRSALSPAAARRLSIG